MTCHKTFFPALFLCCLLIMDIPTHAQTLKIMPMGNSITYDENSFDEGDNIRDEDYRISYRYKLFLLLNEAGLSFDLTGSEEGGYYYFQDPEADDCAGFPGINDRQLAVLIATGYNQRTDIQVTPGPYLDSYPADIILLHIGTNDLDESPDDVEDILNNIRASDPDVIVLVARIINRAYNSSPLTTLFNDNVQAMVTARNDPRIISVNMETGAGINYATDMIDNLHPNNTGYEKMAAKWFQVITNLNAPPQVANIPTQTTNEGTAFANLNLDTYVTDNDDADNKISWTFKKPSGSHLTVSIDANRILHAAPSDGDWYGSETIRVIAEDSGNGAYIKKDSTDVVFTVLSQNDAPVFTSTPVTSALEDAAYSYTVTANDVDNTPGQLVFSIQVKPAWLSFNSGTHILSGTPLNENVGTFDVTIRVSDGNKYTDQTFELNVGNVNDPPVITSSPILTGYTNQAYIYEITATDIDLNDVLTFSAESKPSWLNFSSVSGGGILSNTPVPADKGTYSIALRVSDGEVEATQDFTLTIIDQTSVNDHKNDIVQNIYPNPARDQIIFEFAASGKIKVEIFDIQGKLLKNFVANHDNRADINVGDLPDGIYVYKAHLNAQLIMGKFTKSK